MITLNCTDSNVRDAWSGLISDNEPALVCKEAQRYQRRKELARHDWHSRAEIVEAARRVMGEIHLDPTSSEVANRIIKAKRFYMVKEDALSQPWADRVWLNPPYGRFAPRFVEPKIGTADVKL